MSAHACIYAHTVTIHRFFYLDAMQQRTSFARFASLLLYSFPPVFAFSNAHMHTLSSTMFIQPLHQPTHPSTHPPTRTWMHSGWCLATFTFHAIRLQRVLKFLSLCITRPCDETLASFSSETFGMKRYYSHNVHHFFFFL